MRNGAGHRERVVGVAVLVEAVGQLGLGAGTRAGALDDRVHGHPEQPGGLTGEVADEGRPRAGGDKGDPGWRLLPTPAVQ
jgi:hypothetical protein